MKFFFLITSTKCNKNNNGRDDNNHNNDNNDNNDNNHNFDNNNNNNNLLSNEEKNDNNDNSNNNNNLLSNEEKNDNNDNSNNNNNLLSNEEKNDNNNYREKQEIEELKFLQKLSEKEGLVVRQCKRDGNCFFRAISLAFYGDEDQHMTVRKLVCDYIEKHKSRFITFFPLNTLQQYIKNLKKSGGKIFHLIFVLFFFFFNSQKKIKKTL